MGYGVCVCVCMERMFLSSYVLSHNKSKTIVPVATWRGVTIIQEVNSRVALNWFPRWRHCTLPALGVDY